MQQEKNNKFEIINAILFTILCTILFFLVLGTFYVATEHSIGVNILVWLTTVFTAYYFYYLISLLLNKIRKTNIKPKKYNGWAIFAGLLSITIICLLNSFNIDDYLFVEIMGLISGLYGTFEIIFTINKHKKTKS